MEKLKGVSNMNKVRKVFCTLTVLLLLGLFAACNSKAVSSTQSEAADSGTS